MLSPLKDLLIDQLNDLYDAEQQLVSALPKMAEAASGENLRQGFLDHLEETKVHVQRIEKAFTKLGVDSSSKTCLAMKGLVAEGNEAIESNCEGAIRDVALIGAARRVEHYEIAAYKAARAIATGLDEEAVADLLQQTMDDECETDKKLCSSADLVIEAAKNFTAASETEVAKPNSRKKGKNKK